MQSKIRRMAKIIMPRLYRKLSEMRKKQVITKLKDNYPNLKIFGPISQGNRKLFSQDNQDYIIYENFFKNKKDGFFCDIGGNHPLKINNTLYFEQLGWHGVAFEPLPYLADLWIRHRKAKLFSYALSDAEKEMVFTIVKNTTGWEDMLSFVKETRTIDYEYETEEILVKARTFREVMKEENITHIDYLSLDVEGHELNVLEGIDFNAVRINVLTIENNPPCSPIYGDESIRKIMLKNDFVLWGRIIGLDDIYVHKDYLKQSLGGELL